MESGQQAHPKEGKLVAEELGNNTSKDDDNDNSECCILTKGCESKQAVGKQVKQGKAVRAFEGTDPQEGLEGPK